jgi:hypothetical protein
MYIRRKFCEIRNGKRMQETLKYQKRGRRNEDVFIDYQYDKITSGFRFATK